MYQHSYRGFRYFLNSYLDLKFEVIKKTDNSRYGNGKDKRFVKLGPIASFSNLELTTSSGKDLENFSHAHIVSLMYKLLTSSKGSDDLSTGFDPDCGRRRDELTKFEKI